MGRAGRVKLPCSTTTISEHKTGKDLQDHQFRQGLSFQCLTFHTLKSNRNQEKLGGWHSSLNTHRRRGRPAQPSAKAGTERLPASQPGPHRCPSHRAPPAPGEQRRESPHLLPRHGHGGSPWNLWNLPAAGSDEQPPAPPAPPWGGGIWSFSRLRALRGGRDLDLFPFRALRDGRDRGLFPPPGLWGTGGIRRFFPFRALRDGRDEELLPVPGFEGRAGAEASPRPGLWGTGGTRSSSPPRALRDGRE